MSAAEDLGFATGDHFNGYEMTLIMHAKEQGETAERTRCLTIIQSVETTSAQGKRAIDEIVRKVRGGE